MYDDLLDRLPASGPRDLSLLPGLQVGSLFSASRLAPPLLLLLVFMAVPVSILFTDPQARMQLEPKGTAQGKVLSVADTRNCNDLAHREVYAFDAGAAGGFRGVARLCRSSPFFGVNAGDGVPVQYLASNPSVNRIAGASDPDAPPVFVFLFFPVIAIVVLAASLGGPAMREVLRARALFRKGRLARGTIVFVRARAQRQGYTRTGWAAFEVVIRYNLASGAGQEAVAWCANPWLLQQLPAGASVHIAYSERQPDRAALLEAFVR